MKRCLMVVLLMMAMMMAAAAETLYIDGGNTDRVHLRASPTLEAGSMGLYFTGVPVERLTTVAGGWSRVRIGDETGYVRTEYLSASVQAAFPSCTVDNSTSDWVNLRSGPSFEADPVGRLNNGTALQLLGETASGWSYVRWGSTRGYVVSDFIAVRATGTADAGAAPETINAGATQIVGTTAQGDYICAYQASSGQTIYFVSMEADPFVTFDDVNFDGREDIVVTTARGATNCYYEFFVWTPGGYVRAEHPGVDGIANYGLYAAGEYVLSSVNAGNAGALYEDCLFTWDGTELHLIRRATSDNLREYRTEGGAFVTVLHDRKIDLTVYGYAADGEVTILHQEVIDMNRMGPELLEEMEQRLWDGL